MLGMRTGMSSKWDDEDLAYAAGFLDGEGCFSTINKKNAASIRVTVSNTNRPVLLWLKSKFGGCVAPQYKDKSKLKLNHRPVYIWNVDSNQANILCNIIVPYLKEKAEQALLLIALHQTKQPRGRRKLPEHIKQQRDYLYKRLVEAKHVSY